MNNNPVVNVLISTYNGEKYIREQIDSVLKQTYKNIMIFIRDDGSTDHTVDILKTYVDRFPKMISLECGSNIGFGKSFLTLLRNASEGDFWAFCDQDDVWKKNKIERAVNILNNNSLSDIPLLVHSAYVETDERLNILGEKIDPNLEDYNFIRSITEVRHMGFSEMINKRLRKLALEGDINHLNSHDHWIEMIVMEFGRVFSDNEIMSYHRRLDISISGMSLTNRIKWFRKALMGENEISPQAMEFQRTFGERMRRDDYNKLRWFCTDRYHLINSLKKAFYIHRWRPQLTSEIVCRLLMLVGKI